MVLSDREVTLVYQVLEWVLTENQRKRFIPEHDAKRIRVIIAKIEEEVL